MALKKVVKGQPFNPQAAAWNSFIDASEFVRNRFFSGGAVVADVNTKPSIIDVRNKSGKDLKQYSVVMLTGVIITPDRNENEFKGSIAFDVDIFDSEKNEYSHEMNFAILQEPIKNGKIGLAMINGTSQVKINLKNEDDEYCEIESGSTIPTSTDSGPLQILYKEEGVGPRWAIVRFPIFVGGGLTIINKSGQQIPTGGAMRVIRADPEKLFTFDVSIPDKDNLLNILPLVGGPLDPGKKRTMPLFPIRRFKVSGSIEAGDFIGVKENSWAMEKNKFGFHVYAAQNHAEGKFAYVDFNGVIPIFKATQDVEDGEVEVSLKEVDSFGTFVGDEFNLSIIPEKDDA